MKAITQSIRVDDLKKRFHLISYPEFQREPTVWGKKKKQLLIDSILRGLDIGNIYVVGENREGVEWQCVDGQQRLNAIFSFLGVNENDLNNNFKFKPENELYEEDQLEEYRDQGFWDDGFAYMRKTFLESFVRVVILSDVNEERGDLNLQFQRLQVAQILNGAEKLNAMKGEMRERIFGERGLGAHRYFKAIGVRNARFGGQQTAAQAVVNAVSLEDDGVFARARFADMQVLFKRYYYLDETAKRAIGRVEEAADWLCEYTKGQLPLIKNRALAVSLLLFRYVHSKDEKYDDDQWQKLPEFLSNLNKQMQRVGRRALQLEAPDQLTKYERLQLAVTQASVEKPQTQRRHDMLTALFDEFLINGELPEEPTDGQ